VLKEFDEAGVINPPESQYDADRKYKASEHEDVTTDEREGDGARDVPRPSRQASSQ